VAVLRTRHLQVFLAVARTGSMQRAAREVHLTQPAISKITAEIEAIFAASLFLRTKRGVTLTESGRVLASRANLVLNDLESAKEEIAAIEQGALGRVRLGVLPVAEATILPSTLLALRQSAPRLAIQIEEGTRSVLLSALRRGEIDCVVGRLDDGPAPKDLRVEKLIQLPIKLVVAPSHPLTALRRPSWRDLARYPWILPQQGAPIRAVIDHQFSAAGLALPQPMIESTSMRLIHAVLRGTDLIGVMSEDAALNYARAGDLAIVPIALAGVLPHVGVIIRDAYVSRALDAFLAAIRKTCQARGRGRADGSS
jgi:DNA-binding transcriptional LysR family regulator